MSPCCDEALSDKGAACPSPCRTVSLEIDPAYNNYYFRRLSDSALDSEPSTPVRGPPLLGMEKVFIEIEDVERDALLDDEAFDGREGLPLPHFGPTAEGTAAQTCSRGPEPLEELRLRLEFSTVEEEDEEEVQKEEAEMEVLMQPDDGGGGEGGGGETQDVEVEGDTEGNGMDLATLNENSNNNNHLSSLHNHSESLSNMMSSQKKDSPTVASKLCLNPSPPEVPSASFPQTHTSSEGLTSSVGLLRPCGPLCHCANCAASPPSAPVDREEQPGGSLQSTEAEDTGDLPKEMPKVDESQTAAASEALPELMRMDPEEAAAASYAGQQQETLLQLRQSGLVRRRAERLERLSGLSQESLHSLKSFHACQKSKTSPCHTEEEEEFSGFTGDVIKASTPCQVRLEPLVVPLTNEALLGVVGSGLLTPTSSPHGSTLTRSSSSDSLRSVRGKPGLVRQRAQEIETRMRLAGLTVPSRLKRSNSLAKLGSLNLSSEDLCSACSSDAGTLLLLSLSPEPDPGLEWDSPTASALSRPGKDLRTPERALPAEPRS